jgi:hypothetical protein
MAARRLTEAQRRAMAEDRAEVAARAVLAAQEEAAAWARRFDRLLEVLGAPVEVKVEELPPQMDELAAVSADLSLVQNQNDELSRTVARLRDAILWALGEQGEFPPEPDGEPGKPRRRYWWRSELRSRAGMATPVHVVEVYAETARR